MKLEDKDQRKKNSCHSGTDAISEGSNVNGASTVGISTNHRLPSFVWDSNQGNLSTPKSSGLDNFIQSFGVVGDDYPRSQVLNQPKRQTSLQAPELEKLMYCPIPELDSSEKEDSDFQNKSSIMKEVVKKTLDHSESNLRFNRQIQVRADPSSNKKLMKLNLPVQKNSSKQGKIPKSPSKTLYVRAVDFDTISIEQLCNLFGAFGRVELGMVHLKHKYALIKMISEEEAKNVIKALYGKYLGSYKLLIHYSQHQKFSEKYFSNDKVYHYPKWTLSRSILQYSSLLTSILLLKVLKRQTWEPQSIPGALVNELLATNLVREAKLIRLPSPFMLLVLKNARSAIELLLYYHFMEMRSQGSVITLATLTETQADCLMNLAFK